MPESTGWRTRVGDEPWGDVPELLWGKDDTTVEVVANAPGDYWVETPEGRRVWIRVKLREVDSA